MLNPSEIDRQFQNLEAEIIQAYRGKLKQRQEQQEQLVKLGQRREEEEREILRASQVDLERLDHLVKDDEAALQELLHKMRPSLLQRSSNRIEDAKKFALQSSLQLPNRTRVPIYAITLLSDIQVPPYDPNVVRVKAYNTGYGWGCSARPVGTYEDNYATFWFTFIPSTSGIWDFTAYLYFQGFLIMQSNDTFWTCKNAWASLTSSMDVHQYNWRGQENTTIFSYDYDNINVFELLDRNRNVIYNNVQLQAGDRVWVYLYFHLHADAQGGGAYSEINFSDGNNFIQPMYMEASSHY